ncbi:enoyl-CoA hydratase-related protein, partial [Streptomyces goshikiensis]
MTETTDHETILVERKGRTALLTLNRPKALNALNLQVMNEVVAATEALDRDPDIGCIVLTGSAKAFAAGADIKEMRP